MLYLALLLVLNVSCILQCFCFAKFISQIDQKITELVTEQQKIDAKQSHDKSELEQLKQDIANANKQKKLLSKALENKVFLGLGYLYVISRRSILYSLFIVQSSVF